MPTDPEWQKMKAPMIPADAARMLATLDHLRTIGGVGTGVSRPAFSEADVAARRWLAERMREAGLEVRVDPAGNLFGLPPGDEPAILVGSHSDTQPLGGWLDGALGVAAGLELARAAREANGPRVAVVSFQDEEGRFGGLTGSEIWSGRATLAEVDGRRDADGIALWDLRGRVSEIAEVAEVPADRFTAFLEMHIEQGPVLDRAGEILGVVDAIVGVRSLEVRLEGEANHAGTTPMPLRRDAVQGLVAYATALNEAVARLAGDRTVWTLGRVVVEPNAPSIVPGAATASVQMRDPDAARLDRLLKASRDTARAVAAARHLDLHLADGFAVDPVAMDPRIVQAFDNAARAVAPGRSRLMPSGALHDASNVAARLPVGMLFVPSIGGISHNPREDTARDHLAAGLRALARGVSLLV
jgi:N-carbamoyl-L-amino-acid hydrolase